MPPFVIEASSAAVEMGVADLHRGLTLGQPAERCFTLKSVSVAPVAEPLPQNARPPLAEADVSQSSIVPLRW